MDHFETITLKVFLKINFFALLIILFSYTKYISCLFKIDDIAFLSFYSTRNLNEQFYKYKEAIIIYFAIL